uniref:UDP-N-acetylglucosamine transferase subunit ALG14 isoform X3 n=1 Tax=Myxine glutinosa TaxID=7769 RepID=UPI00358DF635
MSLCVTLLLGIPVVLCLLYMFAAVRAHPRRVRRSRTKDAVSVLVIAGSGGHTAEILWLVRSLPAYYKVQDFLLAETDTTSEAPIRKLIGPTVRIHRVPRAREVGQSWFSSIFSTLRALASSVSFAIRLHPQLIAGQIGLAQRAGSSEPTSVVFVESVCRVRSLSLSAWLLRPYLDALVVQWPPLVVQFPSTCYLGRLV